MIAALLSVLSAGLSLWNDKEKTKYIDKIMKLKENYYAELSKPEDQRDDFVLDNIEFELRIVSAAFCASVTTKNT